MNCPRTGVVVSADKHDASGTERDDLEPDSAGIITADSDSGSDESAPSASQDVEPTPRRRRHPVVRRVLLSLGVLTLVLALLVGGGAWYLTERYGGNIDRVADVFDGLDEQTRPAPATPAQEASAEPVTFLLVGSDTRVAAAEGEDPSGRSDAIMIARFSGDRQHAQLISIPRDSWVDIPGRGMNKINAAYAFGGPSLLIQTVEQLTQVRIDHYVAIDFDGLIQVTDDLGGVDVVVAETTSNGPYTFPAGVNQLNGDEARWYLGQRYGLPGATSTASAASSSTCSRCSPSCSARTPSPTPDASTPPCWRSPAQSRWTTRLATATSSVSPTRCAASDPTTSSSSPLPCWAPAWRGRPASSTSTRAPATACGRTCAATRWRSNAAEFADQSLPDVPR